MKLANLTSLALALASALVLSSCGNVSNRPTYDGVAFKARAKAVDRKETRAVFRVEVPDVSRSIMGARLAAHHAGVTYCLSDAGYGTSKIDWDINPLDPEATLKLDGDDAIFVGECEH